MQASDSSLAEKARTPSNLLGPDGGEGLYLGVEIDAQVLKPNYRIHQGYRLAITDFEKKRLRPIHGSTGP